MRNAVCIALTESKRFGLDCLLLERGVHGLSKHNNSLGKDLDSNMIKLQYYINIIIDNLLLKQRYKRKSSVLGIFSGNISSSADKQLS